MVKRKAEFSVDIVPNCEESVVADGVATNIGSLDPRVAGREPTGVEEPPQPTLGHVNPVPAPVEGGEVADTHPFWALLASAGYQIW